MISFEPNTVSTRQASQTREDVFLPLDVDQRRRCIKNSDGVVYTVDDASRLLIRVYCLVRSDRPTYSHERGYPLGVK